MRPILSGSGGSRYLTSKSGPDISLRPNFGSYPGADEIVMRWSPNSLYHSKLESVFEPRGKAYVGRTILNGPKRQHVLHEPMPRGTKVSVQTMGEVVQTMGEEGVMMKEMTTHSRMQQARKIPRTHMICNNLATMTRATNL